MNVLPLVIGLLLLAAGIYMVTVGRLTLTRMRRLRTQGVMTQGEINSKREVIAVDRRDCYVSVTFRTAAGESIVCENEVSQQFYDRTPSGSAVTIRYMTEAPEEHIIEEDKLNRVEPYAVLVIGIIFTVVGAGVLIIAPLMEGLVVIE